MISISTDNPDVSCPSCHRPMINMTDYYEALDTGIGISIGSESPLVIGCIRRRINPIAVAEILGTLMDSVLNMSRDRKGAKLCREILPRFPRSQICSQCLSVYRRE